MPLSNTCLKWLWHNSFFSDSSWVMCYVIIFSLQVQEQGVRMATHNKSKWLLWTLFWINYMCIYNRVKHRLQYIIFWAGHAVSKIDLPRWHFHLPRHQMPATLLNKGEIGLCPKHYLPSGASQGLVQLAPLPFFCQIHLQLAMVPVVMLHAGQGFQISKGSI